MALSTLFARSREALRNDQLLMAVVAAVTGVIVAYAAILFRLAIGGVQWLGFGFSDELVVTKAMALPWWQIVLVPTLGGLVIGIFLKYVMPGQRPQAVAHVIEAMALRNGRMSLRAGLGAAFVSFTSLGVGASTGREGPVVHLGATLASQVAQRLGLSPQLSRTLLGCGVAAAVSASFNAPIAGVFFALEVIVGHYALSAFAPVVIASVAGAVICRIHIGAEPAFVIPEVIITSIWEFPAFALLGVVCAFVAAIFMWSMFTAERIIDRLRIPDLVRPACGGLLIGLMAIQLPEVLGVGYEATDAALKETLPLWLMLLLIVAKTTATAISVGSRFGGGVFSPSLYLGAMTGGAFGLIAGLALPELATSHGAYAIVGMGALAAAVLGAPISTILIVFELTGDYRVTIAVMVATSMAMVVVQQLVGRSFFHWQLENRGLNLRGGRARHLLQALTVRDVLAQDYEKVPEDTTIRQLKIMFQRLPHWTFVVIDRNERLVGTLSFADLKHVAFDEDLDALINARDVAHSQAPALTPDDTLEQALTIMDGSSEDHLAVVTTHDERRVVGVVHQKDVMRAYNRALLDAQAEEHDEGIDRNGLR